MLKSPDAEYGTKEEESVMFYNDGSNILEVRKGSNIAGQRCMYI